ncbi:MAG: glycosyltransferase [Caldilineaceae bacterium]|nr:glycosyltransferase [Caldilineaceae bacterium]
MRIGVLTHNYPRFAGDFSGIFIKLLCHALVEQGQRVHILAPYDPAFARPLDPKVEMELYRYVWPDHLHQLGYMRSMQADTVLRTDAYLLSPLLLGSGMASGLRWARRVRPQVIHAHWTLPNGLIGALIGKMLGIPLVVSMPGSDATIGVQNPLFRRFSRFVFDQAKVITANSEALRDVAVDHLGADPAKFDLIPYGFDPTLRFVDDRGTADLRAQLGIPAEAVVFLSVGRMVPKKGFDFLIRALADLRTQPDPLPIRLVMVGRGDLWEAWQQLGRDLGVDDLIHWVGNVPVDDLNVYYNMVDVITTPNRQPPADGLNVAVLEAMHCGKPVLGIDVASTRLPIRSGYVFEDGVTALLAPPDDIPALVAAMRRLAADGDLRARLGSAARRVAETDLSWPFIAGRYVDHFQRVVTGDR